MNYVNRLQQHILDFIYIKTLFIYKFIIFTEIFISSLYPVKQLPASIAIKSSQMCKERNNKII